MKIQYLIKFLKRHLYIFILFGPKFSSLDTTLIANFPKESALQIMTLSRICVFFLANGMISFLIKIWIFA